MHLKSCAKLNKKNPEEGGPGGQSSSAFSTPNLNNKGSKAGDLNECSMCGRSFSRAMME